jgi:hypothetical protein
MVDCLSTLTMSRATRTTIGTPAQTMTAELKKGRYVYYHCTGGRGRCGNTYVREEELSKLFAGAVKRVQVPPDVANWIAEACATARTTRSGSTEQR